MAKTGLKHTDTDDNTLIRMAVEDGNEAAFFALYARYHKSVCYHISKYITDKEEIEDVSMESFEKAFKQLASFNPQNKFATWIFRIARNTAFDHKGREKVRDNKIDKTSLDNPGAEKIDVAADVQSPEEDIISSEVHENFMRCIEGLPELYRAPARMCFVDNLGYQEIADGLDLPLNTVKTRISRAKSLIVRTMLDMDED